jgi:hypothetical protein
MSVIAQAFSKDELGVCPSVYDFVVAGLTYGTHHVFFSSMS